MIEGYLPRIMLAAPASGSGKTMLVCGILQAFKNRQKKTIAFKCGPDYIDPMFHAQVTGIPCRNLDTFFMGKKAVNTMMQASRGADIAVLEGVMGYFDGVAGISMQASSYELADVTDTPVILVVNVKGMSLSVVPYIKGFLEYEEHRHICGVILNFVSPMMYSRLKTMIEEQLSIKVFGYCPELQEAFAGSRYLGLQMPQEIENLQSQIERLAEQLEKTVDIDGILALAAKAPVLAYEISERKPVADRLRIGIAKDEAFCFYYQDNLELLEQLGAELIPFSPIHDKELPDYLQGMILGGGYPELFARKLSDNQVMREQILKALSGGLPYLAECGGFLYLQKKLVTEQGTAYPMVGFFDGTAQFTGKLTRFGYISLTSNKKQSFLPDNTEIRAHEFHYYDTDNNGNDFHAQKPQSNRGWDCIHADEQGIAGFPHLYYASEPSFACNFLKVCDQYRK